MSVTLWKEFRAPWLDAQDVCVVPAERYLPTQRPEPWDTADGRGSAAVATCGADSSASITSHRAHDSS